MTIGVDAGALSISDNRLKVGVYRALSRLLKELSGLDTVNDYRLYSFAPIDPEYLNQLSPRMDNLVLIPKQGWFRFRLPLSLMIHPVDLFLGVSQAIPVGATKSIGFIYDLGFFHFPQSYPKSVDRLVQQTDYLVAHSQEIITISEQAKGDIIDHYHVPSEKITVALPGVDERFSKNGPLFNGKVPYFLHVGSLKPGKNIPTLIRAFAEFRKRTGKTFLLLIVGGDYWLDKEILTTIDLTNMENHVRILGFVPDEILPQYYRGATAFTTASLWEGFCLPVVEAMASGCPVIAPNTASFPEVVAEESLLVSPSDVSALASAMERIVTDANVRDVAVAKGIAKAEKYRWKSYAETIYSVISKFL